MEIGIVGFQKTGKTTVFNALTGRNAPVSAFSTGKVEPNIALASVPDERIDRLAVLYKTKAVPATVRYVDLAGITRGRNEAPGEGLGDAQLAAISPCDALIAVLRGFPGPAGEPPDLAAEAEGITLEMALSDLKKVETRLERLGKSHGKVSGEEAKRNAIEQDVLERFKAAIEGGTALRTVELSVDEDKAIRGFQFLTRKPLMLIVNAPDEALSSGDDPTAPVSELGKAPGVSVAWMAGKAEMEIAQLAPAERADFLSAYGIAEPAAARIIRESYALLGVISFLTAGEDECRAWTVRRGALAPEAAGVIHSDLERGFIRAEVYRWEDLLAAGSTAELKKHGKLHLQGKTYEVQDGDVINVLFNV